jgi:hypothetical protein
LWTTFVSSRTICVRKREKSEETRVQRREIREKRPEATADKAGIAVLCIEHVGKLLSFSKFVVLSSWFVVEKPTKPQGQKNRPL